MNNENNSNRSIFVIVLLLVVCIFVLFFPKIYGFITSLSMPEVESSTEVNEEEQEVQEKLDESILESLHKPMMRNSVYDSNTYYSLENFKVSNLSNNDILLNAFLDVYEGNMTNYNNPSACTTQSKQFNKDYLELRIKNILGNNISYNLENFYVPEDLDSKYVGNWNYVNGSFIYMGLCNSRATNIKYYDIEQFISAEYEGNDINVHYYVGFAKVEGNNYVIYKNADYTEEITKGIFTNVEEMKETFNKLDNKNKKIYKYTFKNTLCTYDEYCLYEGKWVNEI